MSTHVEEIELDHLKSRQLSSNGDSPYVKTKLNLSKGDYQDVKLKQYFTKGDSQDVKTKQTLSEGDSLDQKKSRQSLLNGDCPDVESMQYLSKGHYADVKSKQSLSFADDAGVKSEQYLSKGRSPDEQHIHSKVAALVSVLEKRRFLRETTKASLCDFQGKKLTRLKQSDLNAINSVISSRNSNSINSNFSPEDISSSDLKLDLQYLQHRKGIKSSSGSCSSTDPSSNDESNSESGSDKECLQYFNKRYCHEYHSSFSLSSATLSSDLYSSDDCLIDSEMEDMMVKKVDGNDPYDLDEIDDEEEDEEELSVISVFFPIFRCFTFCLITHLFFAHLLADKLPGIEEFFEQFADFGDLTYTYIEPLINYIWSRTNIYALLFPVYLYIMSQLEYPDPRAGLPGYKQNDPDTGEDEEDNEMEEQGVEEGKSEVENLCSVNQAQHGENKDITIHHEGDPNIGFKIHADRMDTCKNGKGDNYSDSMLDIQQNTIFRDWEHNSTPSKIRSESSLEVVQRQRRYRRMVSVCSMYVNKDGVISKTEDINENNNGNILQGSYDENHVASIDEENRIEGSYSFDELREEDYESQSITDTDDEEVIEITYDVCNENGSSRKKTKGINEENKVLQSKNSFDSNLLQQEGAKEGVLHQSLYKSDEKCSDLNCNPCSHSGDSESDSYSGDLSRGYITSPVCMFEKAESSGDNSFLNLSHLSILPTLQTASGDSVPMNTSDDPEQYPCVPKKIQMTARKINPSSVLIQRKDKKETGWQISLQDFEVHYKMSFPPEKDMIQFETCTNVTDVSVPKVEENPDFVTIPMMNSNDDWCVRMADEDYARLYGSNKAQFVVPKFTMNSDNPADYQ